MKLEALLNGLDSSQPAVRLDIVRVLGMLDEVRALPALRARYDTETDPAVRGAIAWAGKRLYAAQQAGYSTLDEIFRQFGINREIENMPDPHEEQLLRRMQDGLDSELRQMQSRAGTKQTGAALAAGLGGALLGGAPMAAGMMMSALSPGAGAASSNLDARPQIGTQRTPATRPTQTDIAIWLRRLREGQTPAQREQAALELVQVNNLAALPHLAAVFVSDNAEQVRQTAQRCGKLLYWGAIYWDMEHDGSLAEEMGRRAAAIGKALPGQSTTPAIPAPPQDAPPDQAPRTDIAEILRKAEESRAKRHKKR
ncbi:MAG: HEAT repeat domain-containing protein [Chloroflexi bacterium]|nr:HEAT repeat domain-containing protein [Chloroflexota bacterium]